MAQADDIKVLKGYLLSGQYDTQSLRQGLAQAQYSPKEIDQMMGVASGDFLPKGTTDTFAGESGLGGLGSLLSQAKTSLTQHPASQWGGDLLNTIKNMYNAQVAETSQAQSDAKTDWGKGEYANAIGDFLSGTPLVGHPIVHGVNNAANGNFGGAAGDLLGLLGPEIAEGAVSGLGSVSRNVGLKLFHKNLPFDSANSVRDIERATAEGVDQKLPAQGLFSQGKARTLDKIGRTDQPGTVMGNLEAQVQPLVTGAAGAQKVDVSTALAPFISKVKDKLEDPTATGQGMAAQMLRSAEPALRKINGPVMDYIFDPAQGFSDEQKVANIEKWARATGVGQPSQATPGLTLFGQNASATSPNILTHDLDVSSAHNAKRGMYNNLSDDTFRDASGAVPPGAKATSLSLSKGYKNAVNEAQPSLAPINEHMHNTIVLQDALNRAAKESPKAFQQLTDAAIGVSTGSAATAATGHSSALELGLGSLVGMMATRALRDPVIASHLGIILGNKFPRVSQALEPFMQGGGEAGELARHTPPLLLRLLGSQPPQNPPSSTPPQ